MEEYVNAFKQRKKTFVSKKTGQESQKLKKFVSKVLISIIFFLVSIIFTNINDKNLFLYKEYVLTESLPFTTIKSWYEDLFGEVLPSDVNTQTVFNGKFMYKDIEDYKDGSKLTVANNSLINSLGSGIVVFIGEKEGYGHTIIIQGADGADIWYGNLTNVSIGLYDYVEKGKVIGEANGEELYVVIKKDNEFIRYENYQNS